MYILILVHQHINYIKAVNICRTRINMLKRILYSVAISLVVHALLAFATYPSLSVQLTSLLVHVIYKSGD